MCIMKTLAVGELKTHFSSVLAELSAGHPIAVGFGKSKRKVAVLVSYRQYRKTAGRKLGLLAHRTSFRIHPDFAVSDEEFLRS
jgi:antitoxin (DNA-binding transcriptional repressor) of toxin-antitoxin stability system